ncbi:hypothetical protein [Actinoplanes sichuanensis]|uniref:Uncharacterized protein n=1 Tax=Actinoplanes sichuanensis TaxID=512349 RepID=A0ABW4AAV3_9ACTN|nr:hypothetical protein [Actinoplanes sichuanensis]
MASKDAASMLGRLLDRSVERIGAMARDGRTFDRSEVSRIAGAWADHTHGLFTTVGARPRPVRALRARALLHTMARGDRAWMIRTAGPEIEPLLGRGSTGPRHYRGFRGILRPGVMPVAPEALAADYDLPKSEVVWLSIERTGQGLRANLALKTPRRYAHGDARLHLTIDGLREAWFDSSDTTGADIRHHDDDLEFRLGAEGVLRAGEATVFPLDDQWHLSRAGRAVGRWTVRRIRSSPDPDEWPSGPQWDTALVFHRAMQRIQRVNSTDQVGRVPLVALCEVLSGAGTRVLAAESPAAFRRLTDRWSDLPADAPERPGHVPESAWLTLILYTAESRQVTVNYADPADGTPRSATTTVPGRVLLTATGDDLSVTS